MYSNSMRQRIINQMNRKPGNLPHTNPQPPSNSTLATSPRSSWIGEHGTSPYEEKTQQSPFIPAYSTPSCSKRTQRLPARAARRAVQCETVVKKRGDIRFAKACQLEVPIQRPLTECLLIIGRFPRPHVFPFELVQHGNVHLAAPAIQQLRHAPDRL